MFLYSHYYYSNPEIIKPLPRHLLSRHMSSVDRSNSEGINMAALPSVISRTSMLPPAPNSILLWQISRSAAAKASAGRPK